MFGEEHKERIIQEFVPGKQVTLAHVIPNPVDALYGKMGLIDAEGAIGIFTITPSEAAIIAADVASKAAGITIGFVDRFNGTVKTVYKSDGNPSRLAGNIGCDNGRLAGRNGKDADGSLCVNEAHLSIQRIHGIGDHMGQRHLLARDKFLNNPFLMLFSKHRSPPFPRFFFPHMPPGTRPGALPAYMSLDWWLYRYPEAPPLPSHPGLP